MYIMFKYLNKNYGRLKTYINPTDIQIQQQLLQKVFKYIFESDIKKLNKLINKNIILKGNERFWNTDLESYTYDGSKTKKFHTPLMWFIWCNKYTKKKFNLEIFKLLIENGADITFQNKNFENITPLMYVGERDTLDQQRWWRRREVKDGPQNLTEAIILEIIEKEKQSVIEEKPSVIDGILNAKENEGRTAIFYFIEAIYNDVICLNRNGSVESLNFDDNEFLDAFNKADHEYGEILDGRENDEKKILRSIENLKSIIKLSKDYDVEIFKDKFVMKDSSTYNAATGTGEKNKTQIMVTPIMYAMERQHEDLNFLFERVLKTSPHEDILQKLIIAYKKIIKIIFKIIEDLIHPEKIKEIMDNRYDAAALDQIGDNAIVRDIELGDDTLLICMTKKNNFDLHFYNQNENFLKNYFDVSIENGAGKNALFYYNQHYYRLDPTDPLQMFLTPQPVVETEIGTETDTNIGETTGDTTVGGKQSKRIRKIRKKSQNKKKKQKKSQKIKKKQTKRRK